MYQVSLMERIFRLHDLRNEVPTDLAGAYETALYYAYWAGDFYSAAREDSPSHIVQAEPWALYVNIVLGSIPVLNVKQEIDAAAGGVVRAGDIVASSAHEAGLLLAMRVARAVLLAIVPELLATYEKFMPVSMSLEPDDYGKGRLVWPEPSAEFTLPGFWKHLDAREAHRWGRRLDGHSDEWSDIEFDARIEPEYRAFEEALPEIRTQAKALPGKVTYEALEQLEREHPTLNALRKKLDDNPKYQAMEKARKEGAAKPTFDWWPRTRQAILDLPNVEVEEITSRVCMELALAWRWRREHDIKETPLAPLTDSQQQVFDFIAKNPGKTGCQIVKYLAGQGIELVESTLTRHYIPELRRHGVRNRPGFGYYVENEDRE